jgi:hypothetical protein
MTQKWRLVNGSELYNMSWDLAQTQNVAQKNPEIVKRLSQKYDEWWASFDMNRLRQFAPIHVGSPEENPIVLNANHWPRKNDEPHIWHQRNIREAPLTNGVWPLKVVKSGTYKITLYRYPPESGLSINASTPALVEESDCCGPVGKGISIQAIKAGINIGKYSSEKNVDKNDRGIPFQIQLSKGEIDLKAWFESKKGETRGAYYVSVELLK